VVTKPNIRALVASAEAAQQPPRALVAGIDTTMHFGPFSGAQFQVGDFYQGPSGSGWDLVYAGADGNGNSALAVYSEKADVSISQIGIYYLPGSSGILHVVSFSGTVLTIRERDQAVTTFDLATLHFADPLRTPTIARGNQPTPF
jgi:hypothetical protein